MSRHLRILIALMAVLALSLTSALSRAARTMPPPELVRAVAQEGPAAQGAELFAPLVMANHAPGSDPTPTPSSTSTSTATPTATLTATATATSSG